MINFENFTLKYDDKILFNNFNLTLKKGEKVGIFAPTGSGKTSILNEIIKQYSDKTKISAVFQDNILIEELTVTKNIILPLENNSDKNQAKILADEWINKLDLKDKADIPCKKLSGGEKQRVNLARAFAFDGDIFLFDEPFSSQDKIHKNQISKYITQLKNKEIIIVSHNENELQELCDRIIYL